MINYGPMFGVSVTNAVRARFDVRLTGVVDYASGKKPFRNSVTSIGLDDGRDDICSRRYGFNLQYA